MLKIILMLIILTGFFSLKCTIQNYLENGIEKDMSYKTFFVTRPDNLSEEEAIEELKTINHVTEVYPDTDYYTAVTIENQKRSGDFYINGSSIETIPKVKIGKNFDDEKGIICPTNFYPSTDIENEKKVSRKDFINMDEMIGETIKVSYSKVISFENSEYELENKELTLKIVGTYQNNTTMIDENVCYGSYELVRFINKDIYESVDLSNQINSIMVRVDDIKNLSEVTEEIYLKGYSASQALSFDPTFFNMITIICDVLLVLCSVFVFAIFVFNNRKNYDDINYEITILKAIGNNEKSISRILDYKYAFLIFIASFVYIILLLLVYIVYKIILSNNPFLFLKVPIYFNWKFLLIIICILFIAMFLTNKMLLKKIKRGTNDNI